MDTARLFLYAACAVALSSIVQRLYAFVRYRMWLSYGNLPSPLQAPAQSHH